jgi:hypothetical protein
VTSPSWLEELAKEIHRIRGIEAEITHLKETTDYLARKIELVEQRIQEQEADRDRASQRQLSYINDLRAAKGLQRLDESKTKSLTFAEADTLIKELRGVG